MSNKESFRSFENVVPSLQSVITDSETVDKLKLSRTKATYLVTEAIGPYFYEKLVESIGGTDALFTVLFDETTNAKNVKELQIGIKFHNDNNRQVFFFSYDNFFAKLLNKTL